MKTKDSIYNAHIDFRGKDCEKKSAPYTRVNTVYQSYKIKLKKYYLPLFQSLFSWLILLWIDTTIKIRKEDPLTMATLQRISLSTVGSLGPFSVPPLHKLS